MGAIQKVLARAFLSARATIATRSGNNDKVAGQMALNPARGIETKRKDLVTALSTALHDTAFDNRYPLHPRRLKQLGQEIVEGFFGLLSTLGARSALALGQSLAQVGVGEKTLVALTACIRRFSRAAAGADPASSMALDLVESFENGVVEGFIKAREEQILSDQEQLRRALSHALESQGLELHIKNHAINTAFDGIMLADLEGKGQTHRRDSYASGKTATPTLFHM